MEKTHLEKAKEYFKNVSTSYKAGSDDNKNIALASIAASLIAIAEVICDPDNKMVIPQIKEIDPYEQVDGEVKPL